MWPGCERGVPPHAGSGHQRYAHQFFSFLFCLIPPPPELQHTNMTRGGVPLSSRFFHSHRHDGRGVSPSLLVVFLLSTKMRCQGGVPPCHHVYIHACNEDLLV